MTLHKAGLVIATLLSLFVDFCSMNMWIDKESTRRCLPDSGKLATQLPQPYSKQSQKRWLIAEER
jgi:hypothetical protein